MKKRSESLLKSPRFFAGSEKYPDKKGLAPVIASVLLILLVMVLAALIFLWARGFLNEQIEKFGQPINNLCTSVDFEAQIVPSSVGENALEVVNRGNIDIFRLDIKKYKDGNSEMSQFKFNIGAGDSVKQPINLRMKKHGLPEKIEIFPVLVGNIKGKHSNKVFTCNDVSKTIQME